MRKIERTGQFRRDYKREARGQHRTTLDADLVPILVALADDSCGRGAPDYRSFLLNKAKAKLGGGAGMSWRPCR